MLSRTAIRLFKNPTASAMAKQQASITASRSMTTLIDSPTANSAWEKSCYFEMDFSISEESTVYEAVQRFAAYDVGCLVTHDTEG
jgi:hypothetical protein